jgi:hypothetical protein
MTTDKKKTQKKTQTDTQSSSGKEEADMAENSNDFTKTLRLMNTFALATNSPTIKATTPGIVAPSNIKQVITHTLQGLLGRDLMDPIKSVQKALDDRFEPEQVSGKEVYTHVPRAYPSIGATDLGAGVSGAQFSLVTFATTLHEQTKSLLRDLHSLVANVDETELQAAKAVFSATWDEFVAELSREGGPRPSRANALADSIFKLGVGVGHLNDLGKELGAVKDFNANQDGFEFARDKVTTKEEEGYLTSFIALTDYYFAVVKAWKNYEIPPKSDLGNGLLAIERSLAVISAAVNELYTVMDLIGIDQHERLVITIGFAGDFALLTIEDFLSWVSSFASREAPALITQGGKRGIKAIITTAENLRDRSREFAALIAPVAPAVSTLPKTLNDPLVLNTLSELGDYLDRLATHAKDMTK